MAFTARYNSGVCGRCDRPILAGQRIEGYRGAYRHRFCPTGGWSDREADAANDEAERREAARERMRDDAEYAAGIEDARRYRENREWFGQEYADAEEYARDMRGLNGDW